MKLEKQLKVQVGGQKKFIGHGKKKESAIG